MHKRICMMNTEENVPNGWIRYMVHLYQSESSEHGDREDTEKHCVIYDETLTETEMETET